MTTTTTATHTRCCRRKHRSHSKGTVPFAWENKPGVSKLSSHTKTEPKTEYYFVKDDYKLPPPPPRVTIHGHYQLPLPPPRSFQPPVSKNSSMKGLISNKLVHHETEDDPFQVAILECTKSSHESTGAADSAKVNSNTTSPSRFYKGGFGSGVRDLFESMSCKCSSGVRDDKLVKVYRVPYISHRYTTQ